MIEAAAMDFPGGAVDALVHLRPLLQAEIEGNEIEGGADPADAGDQMGPAHRKIDPVENESAHDQPIAEGRRRGAFVISHKPNRRNARAFRRRLDPSYCGSWSPIPLTYQFMLRMSASGSGLPASPTTVPSCLVIGPVKGLS